MIRPVLSNSFRNRSFHTRGMKNTLPHFSTHSLAEKATKALHQAGITKEILKNQFGVRFWMLYENKGALHIFMDTRQKKSDDTEAALMAFLNAQGLKQVILYDQPMEGSSGCCGGKCGGCYASPKIPKAERQVWLD